MATQAFQEAVMLLIRTHHPGAMKGSIEDSARCASDLAMVLGAMLAFSFRLNGEVVGRTVLESAIRGILENAAAIDESSATMIREQIGKIRLQ